jgi:hypothetical protein
VLAIESQLGSFLEACFVAGFCDSSSPEARSVVLLLMPRSLEAVEKGVLFEPN